MVEFLPMKLSDLTTSEGKHVVQLAPVQRQGIDIGEDEPYPSINNGIWLIAIDDDMPAAVMLSKFLTRYGPMVQVEIGHLPNELGHAFAKRFLRTIQAQGKSYYRNKAVSFESTEFGGTQETMRVHKLPAVSRNDVVLSKATMAQLDTHIFDFVKCREELKRLGQSGRKGILLHGHPGTGKTHVVHYIAANLPEHTKVLVAGAPPQIIAGSRPGLDTRGDRHRRCRGVLIGSSAVAEPLAAGSVDLSGPPSLQK
ncbi:ATP-binding protein (plasmid) [Mesorhizobium sp. AR02]|uniref:ATP-binding protein n=1 Tax=Mesorhizobium sp. AR02 TaxID=2865837 RepID=UPI00215E2DCA|nr:ATP-binding protein [Mesorhizobium sp. AR02]UVK49889.1 ATP-binding protein [Mesorhizobium sp. AR02]